MSASLRSALWRGVVRHRRREAGAGTFAYRLEMVGLDLDELDAAFAGRLLWSTRRPAPVRFLRSDYLGDPATPLKEAVRDRVERELGRRPAGRVTLLTQLRRFGFVFNPVSFYLCHELGGDGVEAIVAEITNTPWNERFSYVIDVAPGRRDPLRARSRFAKRFHVSPFLGMDYEYDWRFALRDDRFAAHFENCRDGATRFDATLSLRRVAIDGRSLAASLMFHPLMPAKEIAAIYLEALKLWLRRAPFQAHPARRSGT